MIVTSTPLEFARQQLEKWKSRFNASESMRVAREVGCWPSAAAKDAELNTCRGAMAALGEVCGATYTAANA